MMKQKIMMIVAAMVAVGFVAQPSDALNRVGGALYEFHAQNNPGHGSAQWTNLGSAGGFLPAGVGGGAVGTDPFSGLVPELLNDGPGSIFNKSYHHSDPNGDVAAWGGDINDAVVGSNGVTVEGWYFVYSLDSLPGGYGPGVNGETSISGVAATDAHLSMRIGQSILPGGSGTRDYDITLTPPGGPSHVEADIMALPVGEWLQLVLVADGDADTRSVYLNGQLVDTSNLGVDQTWTGGVIDGLWPGVGGSAAGSQPPGGRFNAAVALFAVYGEALNGNQVMQNYLHTIPEPASLALLSLGGLAMLRRRR